MERGEMVGRRGDLHESEIVMESLRQEMNGSHFFQEKSMNLEADL